MQIYGNYCGPDHSYIHRLQCEYQLANSSIFNTDDKDFQILLTFQHVLIIKFLLKCKIRRSRGGEVE